MSYPDWETIKGSNFMKGRSYPLFEEDMPSFMCRPIAVHPEQLEGADVVIIGAPYATSWGPLYAGVEKDLWIKAPKRVRQQSARYPSAYIQEFDFDVFDYLKVVDYGDADIPPEANNAPTAENVLRAQAAVEKKVNDALDVGALPIVIGQNSPCGSFAIAKPVAEHTKGKVGMVSLDTHWDAHHLDRVSMDPRIAGSASWKHKTYELLPNFSVPNLVEIGERGMLERKDIVRRYLNEGARFISSWEIRSGLGIQGVVDALDQAYDGTDSVYAHFDMDVMGGAGPAPGDILGELAEPIGLTEYEVIRIAHEVGKRGIDGFSFICIPPGSAVVYRTIVYVIMYLLAGIAMARGAKAGD